MDQNEKYTKKVVSHFEAQKEEYFNRNSLIFDYLLQREEFLNVVNSKNAKILDVGCGSGPLLESLNIKFPGNELYGVDITPSLIEYAKEHRKGINFKVGSAYKLPFEDNYFDVVIAETLLHHLIGKTRKASKRLMESALNEMIRVCKHNGLICIRELVVSHKFQSNLIFTVTRILAEFGIVIPYFDVDKDIIVSFYTSKELVESIKKYNAEIISKSIVDGHDKLRYKLTLTNTDRVYIVAKVKK